MRHTFCRGELVYDRGEIRTQPGHGRFVPRSLGAAGRGRLLMDADRVLADLRELARLTGGPDGARRVCWTDEWARAREFLRSRLDELPVEVEVDAAGNLWAGLAGEQDGFVIVGSHVDSVPAGGWLDGALGELRGARGAALAGRAGQARRSGCGWSTGPTRRARASGAACSARRPAPGTLDVDEVRDLRDRDGERLEDVVARYDVELDRAHESGARLRGARAYLELHIEQGPVLESRGEPAAAVLGTFGVERHLAVFTGQAAHAGATPMELRRDSFVATAQAALAIRRSASTTRASARSAARPASRASSRPSPGAPRCCSTSATSTPTRSPRCSPRRAQACEQAAADQGCEVELRYLWSIPPIPFDDRLIALAREARGGVRRQGHRHPERAAARRRRDGAAAADRDDLLVLLAAGLAHQGGGHARGRPARGDRGLRPHRGGHARAGGRRASCPPRE